MKEASTVGLDLAKRVFQIHGVDEHGGVVAQKRLQRSELLAWFAELKPCLVGMEACATAHYWARELGRIGHDVRLIPPSYVKPYVRRQKNDRADAAAICEAVGRPSMRFAAVKTVEQQAVQTLHRSRELLIRQRIQLTNAVRAHLAEFGWIFPQGCAGTSRAIGMIREMKDSALPVFARQALSCLTDQIEHIGQAIACLDKQMTAWHRGHTDSKRLATIPGIGTVTASAIIAAIGDGRQFSSGRRVRRLGGPCSPTKLQRRQGTPRAHIEKGQCLPPPTPRDRRDYAVAAREIQQGSGGRVVRAVASAQARTRGLRSPGQQDGPHRLGGADQGCKLSRRR